MTEKQLFARVRDRFTRDCGGRQRLPPSHVRFIRSKGRLVGAEVLDWDTDNPIVTYLLIGSRLFADKVETDA